MKRLFIFVLVFISVLSCKNDVDLFSDDSSNNKILIEITGDENIIINTETIEIKTGSKWKATKRKAVRCVQCKKGFVFASAFLDEAELTEDYVFQTDSTIYITSKLKNENSARDVKLTLKADSYIELDDDELIIRENTTWQEIKDEVNAKLKFQLGYKLLEWRLGRAKNAKVLNDSYIFKRNCTIYAVSAECEKVFLNLIGDENVVLEYSLLEVPFGVEWGMVKKTEYISSIKALDGYKLSDWKLENDLNGEGISDDYIFMSDATLYIFAIKDELEEQPLPEEPINPDLPINIEIDELGMVTVMPPVDGIRGEKIDYKLCNFPKQQNEKRWQGVFVENELITIAPYKIHQYETTYKLWKEVYEWAILHGYVFENAGRMGSSETEKAKENEPVTCVSYRDCLIWCNAYTEKLLGTSHCVYRKDDDDSSIIRKISEFKADTLTIPQMKKNLKLKGFRIPTEAEWEYACRYQGDDKENAEDYGGFYLTRLNSSSGAKKPDGFKGLTLPDGETWESLKDEASRLSVYSLYWNGTNFVNLEPKTLGTSEVGKREPNHLGLYDMSGNVLEWCFDWFSENAIRSDDLYKVDGKVVNPLGAINGYNRVRCGGSWGSTAHTTSCGYRVFFKPEARLKYNGMRLVISY